MDDAYNPNRIVVIYKTAMLPGPSQSEAALPVPRNQETGFSTEQSLLDVFTRKIKREIRRFGIEETLERWHVVCDFFQSECWWPEVVCAVEEVIDDAYDERQRKQDAALYGIGSALTQRPLDKEEREIISQLKPMFFGNEEKVLAFLDNIRGAKPTQITDLVNKMVAEKELSDISCHRDLWYVLNKYGFYDRSENNWNKQIR